MKYVGIDIAKKSMDVTVLSEEKEEGYATFTNNPEGYKKLKQWLGKRIKGQEEVRVVMEATNIYWEEVADYLHERGMKVSVVNPARIKGYAQSELQRNKTDKIDSMVIARFCKERKPDQWQPPTPAQRKLRALSRHQEGLIKSRTQQKNRLSSCNDETVRASLERVIEVLTEQIKEIQKEIDAVIKEDELLAHQFRLLLSIKGFGTKTVCRLLAEFYDLLAYESAKAVAADAGITPSKHESGTSVHRKPKMSRMGKSGVRGALYWPAITAMRSNPVVIDLVKRLEKRGKCFGVIVVAVMRKLLHLSFGVVKNDTLFDPNFGLVS